MPYGIPDASDFIYVGNPNLNDPSFQAANPHPSAMDYIHQGRQGMHHAGKQLFAGRVRSGARSITKGGYLSEMAGPDQQEAWDNMGLIKRMWAEDWSPRSFYKGPTQFAFDPYNTALFNPSVAFYKGSEAGAARLGKPVEKMLNHSEWAKGAGLVDENGKMSRMWDPRMLSRISAAGDYSKMGSKPLSEATAKHLDSYLRISRNGQMADNLAKTGEPITGDMAAEATRLGVQGAMSGRMMGTMEGLRFGEAGASSASGAIREGASFGVKAGLKFGSNIRSMATDSEGAKLGFRDILSGTARSAAQDATEEGAKALGGDVVKNGIKTVGKQLGARLGVEAAELGGAVAEGGLNPVMDFLAIEGFVQMGLDVGKIGVTIAGDALKSAATSFRGNIGKSGFGNGYKDTSAAATSRQRGVLAIQNSRLNARSMLGAEGSLMASHFS